MSDINNQETDHVSTLNSSDEERQYFHVIIKVPEKTITIRNLESNEIIENFAVPLCLNQIFMADGYAVNPYDITRFKVTVTDVFFDEIQVLKEMTEFSLKGLMDAALKTSQTQPHESDVTTNIMAMAKKHVEENNLRPEGQSAVMTNTDPKSVFVAMSFSPELNMSYQAIKRACETLGYSSIRVDEKISSDAIIGRIQTFLLSSRYVVADLTQARPNVYYEIGYFDAILKARGLNSENHLLLVAKNFDEDVHFDLRHRGIELYSETFELMTIVEKWLKQIN